MGSGASKNKTSKNAGQRAESPPNEGQEVNLDEVQTSQIQSGSTQKGPPTVNSKQNDERKQQPDAVHQPAQPIGQGNQPSPHYRIGQRPSSSWQTEQPQHQGWQNNQRPNQTWLTGSPLDIQSWQTGPPPSQKWQSQQQPTHYLGAGGPSNSSWYAPQPPYQYWQREPNPQLQERQQPNQSWQTERLPSSPWQAGQHPQWSIERPCSQPWPVGYQPNQSWQQSSQQQSSHWQGMYRPHQSGRPEQTPNSQMKAGQQPFHHSGRAHQLPNPTRQMEPHSYQLWQREQPPPDYRWQTGQQSPTHHTEQEPLQLVHTGHSPNFTSQIEKQPNSRFVVEQPLHPAQGQAVPLFQNIPCQTGNLQQPLQSAHDQFQAGQNLNQPSQISEENKLGLENKECQPQRPQGESKDTIFIHVEPDIMQFIYGSSYSEELAKLEDEKGIKVRWDASKVAEIISEGPRSHPSPTENIEAVLSFIHKFDRIDIPVKKEIWKEVQKQLPEVQATLSDSVILTYEPQFTLRIVSLRCNIDNCRNRLEAHLERICKEVTFQQQVISNSKEGFIILLKAMNVHELLRPENCKDVEFELDREKQEVRLVGPRDQLKIAMQVLNELMGKASEKPIRLDSAVLTLLANKEAQKTVEKAFKERKIEAAMLISGNRASKVLARSEIHAENAVSLISGLVNQDKIRETAKHSSLTASKAWSDYCKSTEMKTNVIVHKDSSGKTCITGLRDNVATAARMLQFYLDNNSEREEEFKCVSADLREYLLRRRKSDIENFGVKIREGDGSSSFYISGREKPLENAEDFLNGLVKDITEAEVYFQRPGLVKFDESGKLDEKVKEVEEKEKCYIRIEKHLISTNSAGQNGNGFSTKSRAGSAVAGNNLSLALSPSLPFVDSTIHVTPQGHRISWRQGDIIKEKVDILVIPQGACFNRLRSNFDSTTCQAVDELKFGEIATSAGVSLPCSHVILTCCAFWNGPGGSGEGTLRTIVHKSLNEAGQLGGNSIAFPIIGTGNLRFPSHNACKVILEEAVKFCQSYPYSVVKDIRFIVFDRDKSLVDAFKQEAVRIKSQGSGRVQNPVVENWLSVIEVANGDLTQETTDAIVNINNSSLNMNTAGELSKEIAKASGPQVQQECNQLGSQPPGSAVITGSGNLNVRHIIHIVPGSSDKSHLQQCLEVGLHLADGNNLQSISIPTIGTGGYGLSASDSAEVTFKAVKNASASFTSISKVRLVIYQSKLLPVFQQEKQKYLTPPFSGVPQSFIAGKGISIDVINGDLTKENTDAIININSASLDMNSAGELSKAVAKACGPLVQQECNKLGSQSPGSAVITGGGNLNVRHIIHIVPGSSDKSHLQQCLEEGLRLADGKNLQSISIPTIGTGGYGLSASDSAEVTFKAVKNASASFTSISKVRLVIYQSKILPVFQQEKQKYLTPPFSSVPQSVTSGKDISIDVINGDLTQENTDAIVNINSTNLNMNAAGELSKAVAKACGPLVQQECNQLGSQSPGSAVITGGGNLNVRYIIHIVPGSSDKSHLQHCLEVGLRLADGKNLRSISIPTIGTGGYGLSASDSAEVTFQAVRNASVSFTSISKVRIIVYHARVLSRFQQEKARLHQQQLYGNSPSPATLHVSGQAKKSAVRLRVTGNSKASVDTAVNELKQAFTEACGSKQITIEGIDSLSQRQINKIQHEAFKSDFEIKLDAVAKCVTIRGYGDTSDIMTKIMNEIAEGVKLEKEKQEKEHASVMAKMVQWSYNKQGQNINFDSKTNAKLETANSKKVSFVTVSLSGRDFRIDLKSNIGQCSRDGEQIKIKRRLQEVVPLPNNWSPMPFGKDVQLVQLVQSSQEYRDVMNRFQATVPGVNILKIERIQNPALYQAYIVQKQDLDKKVDGSNEKQLFHGTNSNNITKINTQGFNRSFAGINGTAYGHGVYFARDASYSCNYAVGDPGFRKMYLAQVLVGRYCQGRAGLLTPPPLDPKRPELLYDSVVDNQAQPTIFVVFHDSRCFPEYLLTF